MQTKPYSSSSSESSSSASSSHLRKGSEALRILRDTDTSTYFLLALPPHLVMTSSDARSCW